MDKNKVSFEKVNLWLISNHYLLPTEKYSYLRNELSKLTELEMSELKEIKLLNPMSVFLFALFLGFVSVDRFLLRNMKIALARIITLQGLGIWWIVDLATAMNRTREHNFSLVEEYLSNVKKKRSF